jgi:hypothetical protein
VIVFGVKTIDNAKKLHFGGNSQWKRGITLEEPNVRLKALLI